jgi:hypothetical protein
MVKTITPRAANDAATEHPLIAEMQRATAIVSSVLTEARYEPLRPALAIAALREIIGKAEKLIGSLKEEGS